LLHFSGDDENLERERERERGGGERDREREREREESSFFSSSLTFQGNPEESTDSFNHGNRISKAKL